MMEGFTDKPPYKWKTVRVFISSTFRDFHAERDYLIKYVFPELRQWCEKYKLHLVDIDLRWGVTEQEAETGKVIELCLEQIDGCRPFFICMLGNRYGWIPNEIERNKVSDETLRIFPDLEAKWKGLSVTHLEILHAALSPLHGEDPVPHSFFYFRDQNSLPLKDELTQYSIGQKKEYQEAFLDDDPRKAEKLENLKRAIEKHFEKEKEKRIFPYSPNFDISLSNPEDDKLKGRFSAESLGAFGNKVKEHLLQAIETQFAGRIQYLSEKREEDSLANERELHEAFIENRTTLFIGRTELLKSLRDYVNSDSNKILAVYGESGSGKSALLAKFYREYKFDRDGKEINRDVLFIPHFIGASPSSSAKYNMLRRFCEEIFKKVLERQMEERLRLLTNDDQNANEKKEEIRKEYEIPYDPNKIELKFKDFLEKVNSRIIILIDGLNQLDETDRAQELDWLPRELPENVKIIASTLKGRSKDSLKGLTNEELDVGELDEYERREIIRKMPSVFAKTLEEKYINILLKKKATSNPLYLKVALEELRIFGSFKRLEEKINILPDTVIDMFIAVLERLEIEVDVELVEKFFCLLECSRHGLRENELVDLLDDEKKGHVIIIRQLRDYFITKEGLYDFFHRGLSKAVRQHYGLEGDSIQWHKRLAAYFAKQPHFLDGDLQKHPSVHKCLEQPWQEIKGEMWDEVTETLCDLNFIQAKCAAKHTHELVNDYRDAMESIPEIADTILNEKEHQARIDKYVKDLVLYSKGKIKELEIPKSIRPWNEEKISAEIARIKTRPGRADRIKDFYNFLGQDADNLHRHALEIPHLSTQEAWNYADNGPVSDAAGKMPDDWRKRLLLRTRATCPSWNPLPQALKTLKGHTDRVEAVDITPDGKRALSGASDGTCIFWDLGTGMPIRTLKGYNCPVEAGAITPDGKIGLIAYSDYTCIVWDMDNGSPVKTLKWEHSRASDLAITPDGEKAFIGYDDCTCIFWDLGSGMPLNTLTGHTSRVKAVAITPDGKRAISGAFDNTCILWNLETGKLLNTLEGHTGGVEAVALTPDGKNAISGAADGNCIFWDLESGMPAITVKAHRWGVSSVALTPDGKRAISGSFDRTVIFWDMESGMPQNTFKGHTGNVNALGITPDGKRAISGSDDKTCILWNLEDGNPIESVKGHTWSVNTLAITPDGKRALSGASDNTCILWDLENGTQLNTLKGHTNIVNSLAITPDGKRALSGASDKTCILWNLGSDKPVKILKGHTNRVKAVAITPDGNRGISVSWDNTCILWDIVSGRPLKLFKNHIDWVEALAVTPDGRWALSGSYDKTCMIWDLKNEKPFKTLKGHNYTVHAVAITPDGKRAISSAWDSTCILWDLVNGTLLNTLKGHKDWVNALVVSPDGRKALSGSNDNTCILWDLESCKPDKTLIGHTDRIEALTITPDGKRAVSGSRDNSCILWDLESGKKLAQFFTTSGVRVISAFPSGILGGSQLGDIFIIPATKEMLCTGIGITTARKIWDFKLRQYQPFIADCPFCGIRFSPPGSILENIEKTNKNASLLPAQSPCLELPLNAWDQPGLLSECPQCREKLRFNPFVVDNNRDQEPRSTQDQSMKSLLKDVQDFSKQIQKDNRRKAIHQNNLGVKKLKRGLKDQAISSFKKSIQIDPGFALPHINLGIEYTNQNRFQDAINECSEAIKLEPDNAEAHYYLGSALALSKSLNKAKAEFEKAIALKNNHSKAHNSLGLVYAKLKDLDKAIYHFEWAAKFGHKEARSNLEKALKMKEKSGGIFKSFFNRKS